MKKNRLMLFLAVLSLFCVASYAHAGADGSPNTNSEYQDWGNKCRPIAVSQSTTSLVVLSTVATSANLGTSNWRQREIVNLSTVSRLNIYFDNTTYTTYSSSVGVVLSSATSGAGIKHTGNTFTTNYQGVIFGIWEPSGAAAILGGSGAAGYECYQK